MTLLDDTLSIDTYLMNIYLWIPNFLPFSHTKQNYTTPYRIEQPNRHHQQSNLNLLMS